VEPEIEETSLKAKELRPEKAPPIKSIIRQYYQISENCSPIPPAVPPAVLQPPHPPHPEPPFLEGQVAHPEQPPHNLEPDAKSEAETEAWKRAASTKFSATDGFDGKYRCGKPATMFFSIDGNWTPHPFFTLHSGDATFSQSHVFPFGFAALNDSPLSVESK